MHAGPVFIGLNTLTYLSLCRGWGYKPPIWALCYFHFTKACLALTEMGHINCYCTKREGEYLNTAHKEAELVPLCSAADFDRQEHDESCHLCSSEARPSIEASGRSWAGNQLRHVTVQERIIMSLLFHNSLYWVGYWWNNLLLFLSKQMQIVLTEHGLGLAEQ